MWCHLPTIFRRCLLAFRHRFTLPIAGLLFVSVAIITTLSSALPVFAAPNVSRTLGFQGRLLNAAGVSVPDGNYNVQFKLYEGGSGQEEDNPDGELVWTETHITPDGVTGGIPVKNGYLSVDLGSVTPFGTQVNWDSDTIWLSVNVAGSAACSDFDTTGCEADGEMTPMKRITATPYALNAGSVGGKEAKDLAQLGQGVQIDASDLSSLFINKTGTGNLIQLQNAAQDVFTVKQNGDVEFGSGSNHTIAIQGSETGEVGKDLGLKAGDGGNGEGANGGALTLQGGNAGGTNGNGGDIIISGGTGMGTGSDGLVIISTPAYKTAEQQSCDVSCAVTQSSIDSNGAIILNAGEPGVSFSFGDPTNTTAGRVIYVTASSVSEAFTLTLNGGVGANNSIKMRPNMTVTLFWNGSDWTTSSLSTGDELALQTSEHKNIQVGNGTADSDITLLTLDKAVSAPAITDPSLLGSMYYDTTLGKVQCYEEEGWGDCGSSPDTFVSLDPEYAGAVTQGNGTGTFESGICSGDLGINDGTPGQLDACDTEETQNFYHWTSNQVSTQTKSLFVNYELPSTFKEFVEGSTSLMGRTDSTDAALSYQIYKKTATGLAACGTATDVSTGVQTKWQKATAELTADPYNCEFEAGDSIVIKITFTAKNDANAYASTLRFAFSNK